MSLPSGAAGLLHPDSSEDRPSQRHPCSGRPHCASTASRGRASPATQGGHVGTPWAKVPALSGPRKALSLRLALRTPASPG
jgi:hypothetical protein